MSTDVSKFFSLAFFVLLFSGTASAQPQPGRAVQISAGYGMSYPNDFDDLMGSGFYAQGEYAMALTSWFGIRPYAGVIVVSGKDNSGQGLLESRIKSNAFMLGAKARFVVPIPWVAPFLEAGLGVSLGSFETNTLLYDKQADGFVGHIPASLGLALGRNRNFEIAFTYYYHPSVEQMVGAAAFGITLPIGK